MIKTSAGLLMFRRRSRDVEVFLVHPGGGFYANKNLGYWSIPKGEYSGGEDIEAAALREFEEETGLKPGTELTPLSPVRQSSRKIVHAWAFEGDCDPNTIQSNTFRVEWPKGSGRFRKYPEVDRAGWFSLGEARERIHKGQRGLLYQLARLLDNELTEPETERTCRPVPVVMGRHLIALGLEPGKHFGPILRASYEAQLDGEFTTEEDGLKWVRRYLTM